MHLFTPHTDIALARIHPVTKPGKVSATSRWRCAAVVLGDQARRSWLGVERELIKHRVARAEPFHGSAMEAEELVAQTDLMIWLVSSPIRLSLSMLLESLARQWTSCYGECRHVAMVWEESGRTSKALESLSETFIRAGLPVLQPTVMDSDRLGTIESSVMALLEIGEALSLGYDASKEVRSFLSAGWTGHICSFTAPSAAPSWQLGLGLVRPPVSTPLQSRDLLVTIRTDKEVTVDEYEDYVRFAESLTLAHQRARVVVIPPMPSSSGRTRVGLYWWSAQPYIGRSIQLALPAISPLSRGRVSMSLGATDTNAARRFYGNGLGLPLICEQEGGPLYSLGDTLLKIRPVDRANPAAWPLLEWQVQDLDAALKRLRSYGYVPEESVVSPDQLRGSGRTFQVRDHDGNLIALRGQLD